MATGAGLTTTRITTSTTAFITSTARLSSTCCCFLITTVLLTAGLGWPGQRASNSVQATFSDCGGWVNDTKGFIHTPNFPHRFPVPISCKWVFHAPPGKKVVLYFTQYYMRESFQVSEYSHYSNDFYVSKTVLGQIDVFDDKMIAYSPYLVIDFKAHEIGNIHLRVGDFLLDVYGFNITYEIVDEHETERKDACTVYKCSFLGNCLASRNFESYRCSCFKGFYGDECEYGPHCDPLMGLNMCRNGGKCRYFYGSLVNTCECPPGYVGAQCENEEEGYVPDSVCEVSGCNQKCVQQNNGTSYRCECIEGFRLSADNKTCVEKGRMLFKAKIFLPLDNPVETHIPLDGDDISPDMSPAACTPKRLKEELFNETRRFATSDQVSTQIGSLLQDFLNLTLIGIHNQSNTMELEFYFIGEKSERDSVWELLLEFIFATTLCGRRLETHQIEFEPQPVLHSLALQNSEKGPVIEGQELSLVCKVRGSQGLRFEWSKDGAAVNVHESERNMWQTRIPPNDGETHLSILNIEKVHRLDAGEFTCRVWDWNETDTKSIHIRVVPVPRLEISPPSQTVQLNGSATISCLSWDDEQADFTYRWLRDGKEMNLKETLNLEMVEEIFPTGSRVQLRRVTVPATYTCEVKSSAGTVRDHSKISVFLSAESVCTAEQHDGLDWPATAGNETVVLACPRDAVGRTSRHCSCLPLQTCRWQKPDFSGCHSHDLKAYETKLLKLQLGYKLVKVEKVLRKLKEFSADYQCNTPKFVGDLDLLAKLLVYIHEHVQQYGNNQNTNNSRLEDILNLASMTLQWMEEASQEEKDKTLVGFYIMRLMKSIAKDPNFLRADDEFRPTRHESKVIDLVTTRLVVTDANDDEILHSTRDVNITLDASQLTERPGSGTSTITATTIVYDDLSDLLATAAPPVERHSMNSRIVFVGFASYDNTPFFIRFKHHRRVPAPAAGLNDTHCAHWKSGEFPAGHWALDSCQMVASYTNSTLCKCYWPGHYTIFSPSTSLTGTTRRNEIQRIILIGCVVSLALFAASLVAHAFFWVQMKDETRVVSINLSSIMILVNVCVLVGFTVMETKVACQAVKILLYGLYIAAFTFLLLEALKLYANSIGKTVKTYPLLKTLAIGWGIPSLATISMAISSSAAGYNTEHRYLCWITYREWEFYAFVSPVSAILLIYIVVICGAIKGSVCAQSSDLKEGKRKYLFYICRSVLSVIYLLAVVIFSIILASCQQDTVYEYLFVTSMIALAVVSLLMSCQGALNVLIRCLFHPSICSSQNQQSACGPCTDVCLKILNGHKDHDQSDESAKSFKAFVRPKTVSGEDDSTEMEVTIKRDRLKYTKERKEQLQALLGSSGSDGTGGTDSRQLSRASTVSSRLEDGESLVLGPLDNNHHPHRPRRVNSLPFRPARCRAFILDPSISTDSGHGTTTASLDSTGQDSAAVSRETLVVDKVPCLLANDDDDDNHVNNNNDSTSSLRSSNYDPFPELKASPRLFQL